MLERCVAKGLVTSSGAAATLERRHAARMGSGSASPPTPRQQGSDAAPDALAVASGVQRAVASCCCTPKLPLQIEERILLA